MSIEKYIILLSKQKDLFMKKIIFLIIALLTLVSAGVLTGTDIRGTKTYCYYSDGDVEVINGMGICPATN